MADLKGSKTHTNLARAERSHAGRFQKGLDGLNTK
jgi:hypothetical protein